MAMIIVKCPKCKGNRLIGYVGQSKERCGACKGTGTAIVSKDEAEALLVQKQIDEAHL